MATFVVDNNLEVDDLLDSMTTLELYGDIISRVSHVKCFQPVEEYIIKWLT